MDMNLVWASDARISLSSQYKELRIPTVAGVSDVSFEGNIRVVLSPLINEPPLFAGVRVAFLEEPKVSKIYSYLISNLNYNYHLILLQLIQYYLIGEFWIKWCRQYS